MSENINVVDIEEKTDILPVLPLRGLNIFPNLLFHFDVGRKKSIKAIESAMANDSRIFLVSQKQLKVEDPKAKDIYTVGTVAKVRQILKMPNDIIRVLIEGECRAKLRTTLEVYWPCSHSRAIPSFPSQLDWKIGLAWANTRGSLNSPS